MQTTNAADQLTEQLQDEARQLRARFEAVIEPHRPALWRYCRRLTGSVWAAEDLVQETIARALGRIAQFGQVLNPRAYLFRMATNAWLDQQRRTAPEPLESAPEPVWAGASSDRLEVAQAMHEAMSALSTSGQRAVWLLVEAFDFKPVEVAAMVGSTEGAVKAMLHRARAAVNRHLASDGATHVRRTGVPADTVLRRYQEAFERRDVDALAMLFHADATNVIVGDWEEQGLETMRRWSLRFWQGETFAQRTEWALVEGEPCVLVLSRQEDGSERLWSMTRLETADGRIVRHSWYFFCPELLAQVAGELGIDAVDHGHVSGYEPLSANS